MAQYVDKSRDQGTLCCSFNPSFKISEAKIVWPAVKQKQKTEAKTNGLWSLWKEDRKRKMAGSGDLGSISLLVHRNMMQKREPRVCSFIAE